MSSCATPLVSIIIPAYNRRELLEEAVASCLVQSYRNCEVVIVDDGSTDGTEELVAKKLDGEWAGKVSYHQKPNGGASSAKNLGLRFARGEYIQYLDSDDLLRPDKLERQMAAAYAAGGTIDCALCYGRVGSGSGGWEAANRIGERLSDHVGYVRRQCDRTVHVMHTEAPLWRKEFVAAVPAWREDLTVAEEWEYYIRLWTMKPRFVFVEDDLFFVRAHQGEQLSKEFGSLRHSLSFYHALRAVEELLRPTPFWTPEVRAGLLLRARTCYVNLLRTCGPRAIQDFEDWFLILAGSVPSYPAATAVLVRRLAGRRFCLAAFDFWQRARYSGRRASRPGNAPLAF
jgi:glycosyltransferase involved in cell wall biosynthesis